MGMSSFMLPSMPENSPFASPLTRMVSNIIRLGTYSIGSGEGCHGSSESCETGATRERSESSQTGILLALPVASYHRLQRARRVILHGHRRYHDRHYGPHCRRRLSTNSIRLRRVPESPRPIGEHKEDL